MYRVILIDDEPWILKGLMHAFPWEEHGFEVAGSYMDPEEALDRLLREPVDAVFTDIRMPKLDGIALIQRLREENRAAEVVIVSGFSEFEYAQQALRLGAFDYILKPIDDAQTRGLLPRLRAALDEKNEARSRLLLEWVASDQRSDPSVEALIPRVHAGYQVLAIPREDEPAFHRLLSGFPHIRWARFPMGPTRFLILNTDMDLGDALSGFAPATAAGLSALAEGTQAIPALVQQANLACLQHFTTGERAVFRYHNRHPERVLPLVQRAFNTNAKY